VKIDQYLAKIWTKRNSLLFGPPCMLYLSTSLNTMVIWLHWPLIIHGTMRNAVIPYEKLTSATKT